MCIAKRIKVQPNQACYGYIYLIIYAILFRKRSYKQDSFGGKDD